MLPVVSRVLRRTAAATARSLRRRYDVHRVYRSLSTASTDARTDNAAADSDRAEERTADDFADDADTESPRRRWPLYVLGAAGVGGACWWAYSYAEWWPLWIRALADGPTALDGAAAAAIELAAQNQETFRQTLCRDESIIKMLVSALNPDYSIEVQRRAAAILASLTADDQCVHKVLQVNGVAVSLYYAAMGAASREVSSFAFAALKPLIAVTDSAAAEQSRSDLLQVGALSGLSRAHRATSPEVAANATDVLANMLPYIGDIRRIKLTATETNNLLSAAVNIGALYAEQSQPIAAIAAYRVAISIDPNHPHILTSLAIELAKSGQTDEALSHLNKAVTLDANQIEANFHRLKIAAGRNDKATADYVKSLRRALVSLPVSNNDDVHPLLGSSYLLLIQTLEAAGAVDTAIECAYEWTLRCPAESLPYFTYGRLLLSERIVDRAIAALTFADARDPTKAAVKYHLAVALYKNKQFADAKRTADAALRQLAANAPAHVVGALHYVRARVAIAERDYPTALTHLDEHIRIAPVHARAYIDKANVIKLTANDAQSALPRSYGIMEEMIDRAAPDITVNTQHRTVNAELRRMTDECAAAANAPKNEQCDEMKRLCARLAHINLHT